MSTSTIPTEHLVTLSRCVTRIAKQGVFLCPPPVLSKPQAAGLLKVVTVLGGVKAPSGDYLFDGVVEREVRARVDATLLWESTGQHAHPSPDYGTPGPFAEELACLAGVKPSSRVLEPSAGRGHVVSVLRRYGADVLAVEPDPARCGELVERSFDHLTPLAGTARVGELLGALQLDFLAAQPSDLDVYAPDGFDAVVMAPPLATSEYPRADLLHARHALSFLRPGGTLVAVLSRGANHRCDPASVEFRTRMRDSTASFAFHPLERKEVGTALPMVLLVATAPRDRVPVTPL